MRSWARALIVGTALCLAPAASAGSSGALEQLEAAVERHPDDPDLSWALAAFASRGGLQR